MSGNEVSSSVLVVSVSTWWLFKYYNEKKKNEIPIKWTRVGRVGKIIIYPLKSCSPKELLKAECTEIGLREIKSHDSSDKYLFRDRCFLIYDSKRIEVFKILKHPRGILLRVESVSNNDLLFRAPEYDDFHLNLSEVLASERLVENIKSYDVKLQVLDCGDEIATWVSKYLTGQPDITYRMGYFAENIVSRPDPIKAMSNVDGARSVYKHWRKSDGGIYSWLTSYMLLSSASINDVNNKLSSDDRFSVVNLRPNIVIDNCDKYAEDNWKWVKIGHSVVMRSVKLCTRCMHITLDPHTAKRNTNMEPLKTLKTYRRMKDVNGVTVEGESPVLGVNVSLYVPGEIQIGDPVYIPS